ncbi:DNA polymerase IV [Cytophagaceae bacterium AH-315-L13]|nr:DNA polymerase IV [Cytophagaceae bacterium AH-315-L13]
MNRAIVHMDLDSFFVSCERLIDSRLIGKPVIVGGGSNRGVVSSASYEARKFGVHSAMPINMASRLCPEAVVINVKGEFYSKYSNMVTQIISEKAPLYEKYSLDEFYIDVTGMDRFYGCYSWAKELREKIIRETGLPISFGLSSNKTIAKILTGESKPNNYDEVPYGSEKSFLAPLPVKKMPMVGEQTANILKNVGIIYLKDVQLTTMQLMNRLLGKSGVSIWKRANGIDNTPVIPYYHRKSMSLERTFEKDTADVDRLKSILIAMAESLAYQLRKGGKLTSCITVKIRYADFSTYTKQEKISYTICDQSIIKKVLQIFGQFHNKRMRVRLIGIRFSQLINSAYQTNLFENSHRILNLYKTMDKIRNRFGRDSIKRAVALDCKNMVPLGSLYSK